MDAGLGKLGRPVISNPNKEDPMPPVTYVVLKRDAIQAIYDRVDPAVEHAQFIEQAEHASVKIEIWKRREAFDRATHEKANALAKLTPVERITLGFPRVLPDIRERPTLCPHGSALQGAGSEYINRVNSEVL